MEVKTFADLSKLAALCRKKGIELIKITESGIEFKLARVEPRSSYRQKKDTSPDKIATEDSFSEDDALFWSANALSNNPGAQ